MNRRCIICNARLEPLAASGPTDLTRRRATPRDRRVRSDRRTCSAACRKRLQRRRAAGHAVVTDLPGQRQLFEDRERTDVDIRSFNLPLPKRQP